MPYSPLYLFLANLSTFLPAAWLCVLVTRESLKQPLWLCLLIATALTGLYLLLDSLLMEMGQLEYLGVLLYLLVAFWGLCRVSALPRLKLLFLVMMVFSYYCFVVGINWGLDLPRNRYTILYNLASIVFPGIALYWLLHRVFWPMVRDMKGNLFRYLWVAPFAFSVVLTLLANTVGYFSPSLYFTILAVSFLSALSICYVLLHALTEATRQTREAERIQSAADYLALQADQYELLTQNIEASRMLNHDLRHHLLAIKGYLQQRDLRTAVTYCDELIHFAAAGTPRVLCENLALNAVAVHYDERARSQGIDTDIQLHLNEDTAPIHPRDLSVILGNLLENAIEACQRVPPGQRWLRMRCRMVGSNVAIAMDNSFDGIYLHNGQEALSRKHEGSGIGLASIRAVARKYGGDTAFEAKGDTFQSSIYLPLGKAKPAAPA